MERNRCEIEATRLDDTGLGVGRSEISGGIEVHVADLLPGERAEVALEHRSPHRPVAWGQVVRRVGAPSPDRARPACPAFGRCGGCTWQHLAYPAQLRLKRERVAGALADVAGAEVAPVRAAPAPLGYRNKGKYVVARHGSRLVLGGYAPRTHAVVDTVGCRVVAPGIDEVASWVRGAAEASALTAYDESRRLGDLRYVVVRESHAGEVLVALVVTSSAPRPALIQVADAVARHPAVRGVIAVSNDRRDGTILPVDAPTRVLAGSATIADRVGQVEVEVGAGEFFQVNRVQAEAMYRRVAELAGPARRAVDLYAGVGGISFALAAGGAQVTAVELDASAARLLARAAASAGLGDAIEVRAGDAATVRGERIDVAVVNPPRKGLSAEARDAVAALGAPSLVYVSCGPDALGRDLADLAARGYAVEAVEPFDLMPGTSQIETVVKLAKA
jgi:23S rRNA (uracil1939-C5)-methyltransferase